MSHCWNVSEVLRHSSLSHTLPPQCPSSPPPHPRVFPYISHLNSRVLQPSVVFILYVGHRWDIVGVCEVSLTLPPPSLLPITPPQCPFYPPPQPRVFPYISHLNSRVFQPGVVFILCVGHCWNIMEVSKRFFYLVYGIKSHLEEPRPHLWNGGVNTITRIKKEQWKIRIVYLKIYDIVSVTETSFWC